MCACVCVYELSVHAFVRELGVRVFVLPECACACV